MASRRRRRARLLGVSAAAVAALLVAGALRPEGTVLGLYSQGVVLGADGAPLFVPVAAAATLVPGTSFLAAPTVDGASVPTDDAVADARAWLAASDLPGEGTRWQPMAERALLDLDALVLDDGAALAGPNYRWRYVWPRDAAFVAVALSASGHPEDAHRVLAHLADLQEADGTWAARYLPDATGGVPDDREQQADALGWYPWAVWTWSRTAPADQVAAGLPDLLPAVAAAVAATSQDLDADGLPFPSPDYWEVAQGEVTLGTVAPLLSGLRAGGALLEEAGDTTGAAAAALTEKRLWGAAQATFARAGWPRSLSAGGVDAALTFLLPPFAAPQDDVVTAWRGSLRSMAAETGGLRPGATWQEDSVSWTPQTALAALAAAGIGDAATTTRLLDWLDAHRTSLGSLPEKVDATGEPASVAPLAWTAATVLMTLAAVDGRPLPVPPPRA